MNLTSARRNPEPAAASTEIERVVESILGRCPAIRSIWLADLPAAEGSSPADAPALQVVAFGDPLVLRRLRAVLKSRRQVQVLVVTDGNSYESACGNAAQGTLTGLEWRQTSAGVAYYNAQLCSAGERLRERRRAVRVWQSSLEPA